MHDLLSPVKAVILADRQYGRQGKHLITTCPDCGGQTFILGASFVCQAVGCRFGRGSSIDFLARCSGGYEQAIELAADSVPFYRDHIHEEAQAHRRKRKITEFALDAERQNLAADPERLLIKSSFVDNTGISARAFPRGHWFLTSAQAATLQLALMELEADTPPALHGRPVAVAPFWGDHHSIAFLYVLGSRSSDVQLIEVEKFRHSWFGLQQADPTVSRVTVHHSYLEAMRREEIVGAMDVYSFPTALHVDVRVSKPGVLFDHLTFRARSDEWLGKFGRWSHVEGFDGAQFDSEDLGMTNLPLLMAHLARSVENFQEFIDTCEGMKIGPEIQAQLLSLSHQMMNGRQSTLLRNALSRRLLDVDEKGSVYECADGYQVEAGGQQRQVTNFIMDFKTVTSFSALSDMIYGGRFFVGPTGYDFDLPSRRMDNPNQLAETLQNIQTLVGDTPDMPTATIYRPKDFRRIVEIFRVKNAELRRLRGVQTLGWSRKHDQFVLPTAVVDRHGIHTGVRYHPDEEGEHHCYSSDSLPPATVPEVMPELDPYLAEFLAALLSQAVRYHHGLKVRLWPLLNNADTREKAGRIFAGIGQTAPLRLTKIIPRNLELNRGLPCLIAPLANDLQQNKLQLAGAVLANRGLDLTRIDDDQIDRAAIVLPALLSEIARRLLAGEPVSFRERRSIMPIGTLADEGARLLQADFWPAWPTAGQRWATVDHVFEVGEPVLQTLMAVDEQEDAYLLRPALWEKAGRQSDDLAIELGLCCVRVSRVTAGILVDRLSMSRLLGEFYGEVPVLQMA